MAKKNEEWISVREYSRRRGCSDTAVHKAMRSGKIVRGLRKNKKNGRPEINPVIADVEWKNNRDPNYERTAQNGKPIFDDGSEAVIPEGAPSSREQEQNEKPPKGPTASDNSLASAKRAQAVFKAKLSQIEYEEKLGKLVDKEKVYKSLYGVGQELRESILAIPDRHIDNILACHSRNEAHIMLYEALAEALEKLSRIDNIA